MDATMDIEELVSGYVDYLVDSFDEVWTKVKIPADKLEALSAIGGLLSRQITLSIELAQAPSTWNGHSAPLFLRSMTDLYITLAWMMDDLEERPHKYIMHGLGEAKLLIEHYKLLLEKEEYQEDKENLQQMIEFREHWINSQRNEFFVEVDVGTWSNLNCRKMAQEADCEDLYNFAYTPFSQVAHSMWPHVSVYNMTRCKNPLHKHHLIPALLDVPLDPDYLYRSCKYVDKTYRLFEKHFGVSIKLMPLDWWNNYWESIPIEEDVK